MSWELHDPEAGKQNYWSHMFKMGLLCVLLTLCLITVLA